jgi:hypothetical protein
MLFPLLYHFAVVFCIASIPTSFFLVLLKRWNRLPEHTIYISALAAFGVTSYVIFWTFFASHRAGIVLIYGVYGVSILYLIKMRKHLKGILYTDRELLLVHLFVLVIGVGYIGVLCAPASPGNGDALDLSAHRFNELPIDNVLPVIFANQLENGGPLHHLFGDEPDDWLSSDRPPLQTGIILTLRPLLMTPLFRIIGMRAGHTAFSSSLWFQLFWVPALWALLRTLGASIKQTSAVVAITACTGFGLLYSLYTWPKFGAAALVLGGVSILLADRQEHIVSRWSYAAGMFALAHLAHGGSDFSLIALSFLVFAPTLRPNIRTGVIALLVFVILNLPWIAYQKFYAPPGNRLLKMHLAGVNDVDARGFLTTLTDRYREIGWKGAWENKRANFARLAEGNFKQMINFTSRRDMARTRRDNEFFFFFRALSFGIIAVLAAPILIFLLHKKSGHDRMIAHKILLCFGWTAATVTIWCILMFMPGGCVIHQGSLAPLLAIFSTAMLLAYQYSRILFCAISCFQLGSFITTWTPVCPPIERTCDPIAYTVSAVSAGILLLIILFTKCEVAESPQ